MMNLHFALNITFYVIECYSYGTKTNVSANIIKNEQTYWGHIADEYLCQDYCKSRNGCEYFVFNKNTQSCNLKNIDAKGQTMNAEGFIFGPKYCPSKYSFQKQYIFGKNE